jgi:hypothetical protein
MIIVSTDCKEVCVSPLVGGRVCESAWFLGKPGSRSAAAFGGKSQPHGAAFGQPLLGERGR